MAKVYIDGVAVGEVMSVSYQIDGVTETVRFTRVFRKRPRVWSGRTIEWVHHDTTDGHTLFVDDLYRGVVRPFGPKYKAEVFRVRSHGTGGNETVNTLAEAKAWCEKLVAHQDQYERVVGGGD